MSTDDVLTLETFTKGDTEAVVYFAAVDRSGSPLPLSGKTVTVVGRRRGASAAFTPIACTVTGAASGEGEADVAAGLCVTAGEYRCQLRVLDTVSGKAYRLDPFKIVVRGAAEDGET